MPPVKLVRQESQNGENEAKDDVSEKGGLKVHEKFVEDSHQELNKTSLLGTEADRT